MPESAHGTGSPLRNEEHLAGAVARLTLARRLAVEAEEIALGQYQSPGLVVKTKPDGSVVTDVDTGIERMVREAVDAAFPGDGVLGEEEPETPGASGFRWVLDPIDGTGSFVRGIPTFAVLIGIECVGEQVAGLASFPALGEVLSGGPGLGDAGEPDVVWSTRLRGDTMASVSGTAAVGDALLETTRARTFSRAGHAAAFGRLSESASKLRGWDDAFAFALVATGRVDGAVAMNMNLWDVAAFIPIIRGAGGAMTSWDGERATDGARVLASNGHLHSALAGMLTGV